MQSQEGALHCGNYWVFHQPINHSIYILLKCTLLISIQ